MGFYWKFTRSGAISSRYISLIIDVEPSCIDPQTNIWHTSFEELQMFLVLLHDVEVINNPGLGPTKEKFRRVVETLGYEPTLAYRELRYDFGLVLGQDVMGRHNGRPLDYGYYSNMTTPTDVNVTDLEIAGYINAEDGRRNPWDGEDKLSCYREIPGFQEIGFYWDFMPKHIVMNPIVGQMLAEDNARTNEFLIDYLRWLLQQRN